MIIKNMPCPKCECPLEADYCEVFFTCTNDHHYFIRVKQEDLIDEN